MHHDNHYEPGGSPRIHRTPSTSIAAALLLAATGLTAAGALADRLASAALLRDSNAVIAAVPLDDTATAALTAGWAPLGVAPAGTSSLELSVSGLPAELTAASEQAATVGLIVTLLGAALAAGTLLAYFFGRLTWRALAAVTAAGGLLVLLGGTLGQLLAKDTAQRISVELGRVAGHDTWTEPGFLSGLSPVPVIAGLLLLALAFALRSSTRLAREADGVF